jgi:hypothetical protein
MSIIRCTECEENKDSDFIEFYLKKEGDICEDCHQQEPDYEVENYFDKRARDLEELGF